MAASFNSSVISLFLFNFTSILLSTLCPIPLYCEMLDSFQHLIVLILKYESHLQIQCGQRVVDRQCFSYFLCSFIANFIALQIWMCQAVAVNGLLNGNLTCKCNVVNVLLIANALPIFSAPSCPISLSCEWNILSAGDEIVFDKCKPSPSNPMWSICDWLSMLLLFSLLLHLQFY